MLLPNFAFILGDIILNSIQEKKHFKSWLLVVLQTNLTIHQFKTRLKLPAALIIDPLCVIQGYYHASTPELHNRWGPDQCCWQVWFFFLGYRHVWGMVVEMAVNLFNHYRPLWHCAKFKTLKMMMIVCVHYVVLENIHIVCHLARNHV